PSEHHTLSLHDALPIWPDSSRHALFVPPGPGKHFCSGTNRQGACLDNKREKKEKARLNLPQQSSPVHKIRQGIRLGHNLSMYPRSEETRLNSSHVKISY